MVWLQPTKDQRSRYRSSWSGSSRRTSTIMASSRVSRRLRRIYSLHCTRSHLLSISKESLLINKESLLINKESLLINRGSLRINQESLLFNRESLRINQESLLIAILMNTIYRRTMIGGCIWRPATCRLEGLVRSSLYPVLR
jgi:hypothetical protein